MDKLTLFEILNTEFSFTLREIEEMLDEELSKAPEEMDTELIDLCVDILDREFSEENAESKAKSQKSKKVKVGKVLLIAAILILILSLSLSASAKFFHLDASDKVVQFLNNHFNVHLGNENTASDDGYESSIELINYLNDYGFENITLPAELMSEDYSAKIDTTSLENIEKATITFKSNSTNIQGNISIIKYRNSNNLFTIGKSSVSDLYNQVKQISVKGMDVLIFSDNTNSYIYYIDNNIEYDIAINCDFDSAVEIAETIK